MSFAFACPSVLLEAAWRSRSRAEGVPSSSSHVSLGGSPQLRRTLRKPVELDMPSYKCLPKVLCSDFPRGEEAALSYLRKAEVWPNSSYSPSRRPGGGLSVQTLLLALTPTWQSSCRQLVRTQISIWVAGMWPVPTHTHRDTGAVLPGFL